MGHQPDLDEEKIVARIRERLRTALAGDAIPPLPPRPAIAPDRSPEAIRNELTVMLGTLDLYDAQPGSYRRVLAPVVRLARKVARKLLAPSLDRQVSYNSANHRLVTALLAELDALKTEQQALRRRCDALETELEAIREDLAIR